MRLRRVSHVPILLGGQLYSPDANGEYDIPDHFVTPSLFGHGFTHVGHHANDSPPAEPEPEPEIEPKLVPADLPLNPKRKTKPKPEPDPKPNPETLVVDDAEPHPGQPALETPPTEE